MRKFTAVAAILAAAWFGQAVRAQQQIELSTNTVRRPVVTLNANVPTIIISNIAASAGPVAGTNSPTAGTQQLPASTCIINTGSTWVIVWPGTTNIGGGYPLAPGGGSVCNSEKDFRAWRGLSCGGSGYVFGVREFQGAGR